MGKETYTLAEGYKGSVVLDYVSNVNLAMVHNLQSALKNLEIHNETPLPWSDVKVSIAGEMIKGDTFLIDSIASGRSLDLSKDVDIVPSPDELIRLTEPVVSTFTLRITADGKEILSKDFPLCLMAYDQWCGSSVYPELLSAFVLPNHPMLTKVITSASRFLKKIGGTDAFTAYQSGDANRVREQVAAIYEALRSEGFIYVEAPASFESSGQRIRTVDKILTEKLGNCLDLSLLFASCLEAVRINPILVLTKGHAFVGAWLVPGVDSMVGDDMASLRKGLADGISDFVFVEATMLTSEGKVSFEEAASAAAALLQSDDQLDCYINVAECRINRIRPIPLRVLENGSWVVINETDGRENATQDIKRIDRYDLSAYDNATANITKYTIWERKLLDFSLRNSLLNIRDGKKNIRILAPDLGLLEDAMQDGKSFRVYPNPNERWDDISRHTPGDAAFATLEDYLTSKLSDGCLFSYCSEEEVLKDALKYAYRASRTSLEENGANNLYFVLGALKWYESPSSDVPRLAPLLLLPIEIVRGAKGAGYTIRKRDEEIAFNITLSEMLRQQHEIDLSVLKELPTDEHGADVKKIFAIVRDKIRKKRGWDVIDSAMIGLFSFNKFVMWNDIHTNSAKLHRHPIISSLVEGKLNIPLQSPMTDAREADESHKPEEFTIPIDVDSSQLEAIIDSGAGKSFILHGPPGTGKSQTITNMIANALYQGKRVLFVAEKMAALSVVQSRLEKIGIAPFCLELHSNKVSKQHVLGQFEKALDTLRIAPSPGYREEAESLYAKRCELRNYIEALHHKDDDALSLYDCICGYLSIPGEEIRIDISEGGKISARSIEKIREVFSNLQTVLRVTGNPGMSPFLGLDLKDGSSGGETELRKELRQLIPLISTDNNVTDLTLAKDDRRLGNYSSCVEAMERMEEIKSDLTSRYGAAIAEGDLPAINRQWQGAKAKWFLPRFFAKRSMLKRYALQAEDMEYICECDVKIRENLPVANAHREELHKIFGVGIKNLRENLDRHQCISRLLASIEGKAGIEVPDEELPEALVRWTSAPRDMRDWFRWCEQKRILKEKHLEVSIGHILSPGSDVMLIAEGVVKGIYHARAMQIINSDERLRYFNGMIFGKVIEEYRRLTKKFQALSKRELYCKLAGNLPSMAMEAYEGSELGILKRNIKSKGRGTSIRRLMDQIPTLLPKLCPCMLMSPLSVAQYIDLDNEKFDLVIFDEASQMPTSEAVGAIARGKSLVVVGDPKQMPPTSFFVTSSVGEDEASIDDLESILDDCLAMSIPSKHLTWHYRSKHESLIAFSNSQYYGGHLTTFPSVDDSQRKVTMKYVKGEYGRSGSRVNLIEARAVVDEVLRRLADPELSRQSIGIVSFSKVQQDKIEDLLTDELSRRHDLEARAYDVDEPVFVKNLENVQGDERDVILFSVGYGPDKNGKVSMNFGPLNNAGGERRLNVAVSRARYEMMVFSSLKPEQIDLRRSSAAGVEGLKKFLEFAEKGSLAVPVGEDNQQLESPISRGIAERLREKGFNVSMNIGRSKFKVDLAISDPEHPETYLLGILLDGPSYYDTKTVRDREIVQPSVMKMLHWNIMRIWTLDWFERPDMVIDSICGKIQELLTRKPGVEQEDVLPEPETVEKEEREDNLREVQTTPARDYIFAGKIDVPAQVQSVDELAPYRTSVKEHIREIVKGEQPITLSLLYKRIVKLWGLSRVSPRLQEYVDNLLRSCHFISSENRGDNLVLWENEECQRAFSGWRVNSDREIQDIPMLEVENAMKFVIEQQVALQKEDLKRLTANQLGFSRKGANIDTATEEALMRLVAEDYVGMSGDKVSLK